MRRRFVALKSLLLVLGVAFVAISSCTHHILSTSSSVDQRHHQKNGDRTTESNPLQPVALQPLERHNPRSKSTTVNSYYSKFPSICNGKEKLLDIVQTSQGIPGEITAGSAYAICKRLPLWTQVQSLYGPKPAIVGLDTCPRKVDRPRVAVAGLYNTGTNHMVKLLAANFNHSQSAEEFGSVPWGKHVDIQNASLLRKGYPRVFPVILVKDPYSWFQSMCRSSYDAEWDRSTGQCPQLLKSSRGANPQQTYPVSTTYPHIPNRTDTYTSLADFWSVWNRNYVQYSNVISTRPRLMIRYEDLLFHAPAVMNAISNCTGLKLTANPVYHFFAKSKNHKGKSRDLIQSLISYGLGRWMMQKNASATRSRMTKQDMNYAREKGLDPQLMKLFQYQHPIHN